MQEHTITNAAVRTSAIEASNEVAIQKTIIGAMRSSDSRLPFATMMLSLMEQSAAMAKMNLVFLPSIQTI